jgi:hypothetical protein
MDMKTFNPLDQFIRRARQLVMDLTSPDFMVRQAATTRLAQAMGISPKQLGDGWLTTPSSHDAQHAVALELGLHSLEALRKGAGRVVEYASVKEAVNAVSPRGFVEVSEDLGRAIRWQEVPISSRLRIEPTLPPMSACHSDVRLGECAFLICGHDGWYGEIKVFGTDDVIAPLACAFTQAEGRRPDVREKRSATVLGGVMEGLLQLDGATLEEASARRATRLEAIAERAQAIWGAPQARAEAKIAWSDSRFVDDPVVQRMHLSSLTVDDMPRGGVVEVVETLPDSYKPQHEILLTRGAGGLVVRNQLSVMSIGWNYPTDMRQAVSRIVANLQDRQDVRRDVSEISEDWSIEPDLDDGQPVMQQVVVCWNLHPQSRNLRYAHSEGEGLMAECLNACGLDDEMWTT